MITPAHGCRNVKTGLDWPETDYWPVQKCLTKLYFFLPPLWAHSDSVHAYIGWLFQSQPPTSSLVRDKYCLRSSTFHAWLPPPVPWPAKSEGWNSCQTHSPMSFEDDWKEVFVLSSFEGIPFKRAQKQSLVKDCKDLMPAVIEKGNVTFCCSIAGDFVCLLMCCLQVFWVSSGCMSRSNY